MPIWLKLTSIYDDTQMLINMDNVTYIDTSDTNGHTKLHFVGGKSVSVCETFEEITNLVRESISK